ncbi:hypothetical protein JXJ21_09250 [candidate division KSB1 bacterium]|nr:hypothetical protein [candidate division KSB1 bacterium]
MKKTHQLIGTICIVTIAVVLACKIDHGLEPINSGFSGTIHYHNAWPDSLNEVRLVTTMISFEELFASISKGDVTKLLFSEPLPTYVDSCQYTFWTKPATYSVVMLAGKRSSEKWSEKSILSIYPNIIAPRSVVIPDKETVVEHIDLTVRFK